MTVTASQLRADVYRILDRALESGEVVEIERRGQVLRLVPPQVRTWLDRLPRHDGAVRGDPEALVHVDWSDQWAPGPL